MGVASRAVRGFWLECHGQFREHVPRAGQASSKCGAVRELVSQSRQLRRPARGAVYVSSAAAGYSQIGRSGTRGSRLCCSGNRRVSREGVIPERAFGPASAAARASFEESGTGARCRRGRRQGLDGPRAENGRAAHRARCGSGGRDQARPGAGAGARWRGCGRGVGAVGAGDHVHAGGHGTSRRPLHNVRVDGVASMAPMPSDVAATTQRRWRRDESAAAETRRHVSARRSPSCSCANNYIRPF